MNTLVILIDAHEGVNIQVQRLVTTQLYRRPCTSCNRKGGHIRCMNYVGLGPLVEPATVVFQQPPAATTGSSSTLRLDRKSRKTVDGSPFVKISANCDTDGT